MLRVAIIGCGKIADAHASQIMRIQDCKIVGVCDREPLMARQLAERFGVTQYCAEITDLLTEARPDVIHITTPPETHFELARVCLEQGVHVYVEKPFTLHVEDAERLVALAERKGLKITAGHDLQFSHVARRARALVNSGYLGGRPIHMESSYCYRLDQSSYVRALLGDKRHWVRNLPGKLLQNIISHGIARIAEYMATDNPQVVSCGFVSPLLKRLGGSEILDELRVIISEPDGSTAYFTFSSQMRPSINEFRIYGPINGLSLDQDHEMLVKLRGERYKSYAELFVQPLALARQHLWNLVGNAKTFLARDFHMESGKKYLIEAFYRSVIQDMPVPIPYREILLTYRIMDDIFHQINARRSDLGFRYPVSDVPSLQSVVPQ